jgi:amidohydrolase
MASRGQLRQRVAEELERLVPELWDLSNDLHAHPELAFEEFHAVEVLTAALRNHGASVVAGVGGLPTAFRATFRGRSQRPTIAILAEYDALPGVGHACGHNIIAASSVGAALAVRVALPELSGQIEVIGTPAEEGGAGKVILVEQNVFSDVDIAMIVHPSTANSVTRSSLALNELEVEFEGVSAHASAHPDKGINALDAVILTFVNINALRQHLRSDARVHGIITNGGSAANVIPDRAAGRFLVRAADRPYAAEVLRRVQLCAEGAATATGAKLKIGTRRGYDSMAPNQVVAKVFRGNLELQGYYVQESASNQRLGSTDMGNVSHVVPSIHGYVAIADKDVASHSIEFAQAAVSEAGRKGLVAAAKALALTAVDLLIEPKLVEEAKEEFRRSVG